MVAVKVPVVMKGTVTVMAEKVAVMVTVSARPVVTPTMGLEQVYRLSAYPWQKDAGPLERSSTPRTTTGPHCSLGMLL